ncbi:Uncharacterised protein [Mycobacteroides abscessus subsp. abscessus]|nr:Uncharacterised protein [Mycobacteroides abscessus subsp. abscessus]
MAQVASSWLVIWKQPSPSMAHTSASGRAILAPMAAGTAKPMVPRPPELSQVRGFSYLMNCAAHIWCCPTPATYTASGPAILPSVSMTNSGPRLPSCCASYPSGYVLRTSDRYSHHSERGSATVPAARSARIASISSMMTFFTSPTIGTSACRFLPISAGSMSA